MQVAHGFSDRQWLVSSTFVTPAATYVLPFNGSLEDGRELEYRIPHPMFRIDLGRIHKILNIGAAASHRLVPAAGAADSLCGTGGDHGLQVVQSSYHLTKVLCNLFEKEAVDCLDGRR